MKKIILCIIMILICFSIFTNEKNDYGYLKVSSIDLTKYDFELYRITSQYYEKWYKKIYITNGIYKLMTGDYKLVVYKEKKISVASFIITSEKVTEISIKFVNMDEYFNGFGYLTVNTDPVEDGNIIINNMLVGKSGKKIKLPVGEARFYFKNKKYIAAMDVFIFKDEEVYTKIPLVTKTDLNTYLRSDKFYREHAIFTANMFYLFGVILPPTNLLFMSFYANAYVLAGFMFLPYMMAPICLISLASSITGWVLLGVRGYKYLLDEEDEVTRNYFISSMVTIGSSYLINFTVGLIAFILTMIGSTPFENSKDSKYKYIRELMLEVTDESVDLSYGIKF